MIWKTLSLIDNDLESVIFYQKPTFAKSECGLPAHGQLKLSNLTTRKYALFFFFILNGDHDNGLFSYSVPTGLSSSI